MTAAVAASMVLLAVGYALASGETTAALTLLGALIVAVLTAWAADQRLTRQLSASAERHERELAHDREQREASRLHERELADLADLRAIVDDVIVAVRACGPALRKLVTSTMLDAMQRPQGIAIPRAERTAAADALAEPVAQVLKALAVERVRLELRLGHDDALVVAVSDASSTARALSTEAVAAIRHRGVPISEGEGWRAVRVFEEAAARAEREALKRTGAIVASQRSNGQESGDPEPTQPALRRALADATTAYAPQARPRPGWSQSVFRKARRR